MYGGGTQGVKDRGAVHGDIEQCVGEGIESFTNNKKGEFSHTPRDGGGGGATPKTK